MAGPAGIKDVASRAGVSVGTVSNVINRPHLVRAETRVKVESAMADLGFVRNESARQLRAGSSRIIAYVFIDPGNPFFTDLARGAEEGCQDSGLALVMCNTDGDPTREAECLSLLLEQRVHGVLLTTVDERSERLRSLPRLGVPVVLVDRGAGVGGDWCSVSVDDVLGGELAAGHLLGVGHRRLGFVGGPLVVPQVADRLAGVRRALECVGRDPRDLLVVETTGTTIVAGRDVAHRITTLPPARRPTALCCANDLVALGLERELLRAGLRIPDDVALVGYDDIDFATCAAVPLTTVRQPRRLLGRTAAELLLREAEGPPGHVHQQVRFRPDLVIRESTLGSAAPDGEIARA